MHHTFFQSSSVEEKMENGTVVAKLQNVVIRNGKGTKTVETLKHGKKTKKTVNLTKNEVQNVQNKVFMPNFWKNCKPGEPCASKNRTRKHRRH
jgi:hypothetical protein